MTENIKKLIEGSESLLDMQKQITESLAEEIEMAETRDEIYSNMESLLNELTRNN